MQNLMSAVTQHLVADRSQRHRDRRAHYASSVLNCPRDQYWSYTGEPTTNPTDVVGALKMLAGNGIESQLIKQVFSDLHWYGYHMLGTQVQVGGSNPNWDGSIDALMSERTDSGWSKFAVEIKSKSGYGADLFLANPTPQDNYLVQLGLYLKDLSSKGVTERGCLFYLLLSDRTFGTLVQIDCNYDSSSDSILATHFRSSLDLTGYGIDCRVNLGEAESRLEKLDKYLADRVVPEGEFKYKYDLTPEFLSAARDLDLQKALKGTKVLGDWQPKYSRYLDKQLELDGVAKGYTESEVALIRAEYRRRKPKSRL